MAPRSAGRISLDGEAVERMDTASIVRRGLTLVPEGQRVFGVQIEGASVISDLDVFAAGGGALSAYDQTVFVEVSDGVLDISFTAQRGDQPIVNAVLVTELPPGSPF